MTQRTSIHYTVTVTADHVNAALETIRAATPCEESGCNIAGCCALALALQEAGLQDANVTLTNATGNWFGRRWFAALSEGAVEFVNAFDSLIENGSSNAADMGGLPCSLTLTFEPIGPAVDIKAAA